MMVLCSKINRTVMRFFQIQPHILQTIFTGFWMYIFINKTRHVEQSFKIFQVAILKAWLVDLWGVPKSLLEGTMKSKVFNNSEILLFTILTFTLMLLKHQLGKLLALLQKSRQWHQLHT